MSAAPANGVAPDAAARVNGILAADASKPGVAVHSFDPNASPQEKAAAAAKGRDALKSTRAQQAKADGTELAVDTGATNVVPTITISDVETEKTPRAPAPPAEPPTDVDPPGAMPAGAAPEIPDWYTVGWRAASGIDDAGAENAHARSILAQHIDEQYYGQWYHSAALVFFAVFASHFLTRFGFGIGWLFIILAVCNTYYTTSMERFRRHARDDIQRELVKTRLASEAESADWINHFLERFWLIYEPVLSATIISTVDQVLSANTPAFLDSLRLSTFTLGNKAPRIDQVRTFPKTQDDIVMMDWGISFTPNDLTDVTPRQQAYKANPKIVLSIKLGAAGFGPTIPVMLEDIAFRGLMRIRLKLMTPFPHVQIVDISFLEKPVIDFVLRPLGGDSFDINHIPGLQAFIRDTLHSTLGPMMYEPNVFTLNLEQMLSGAPLDTAVGVLQVTIDNARGIKGNKVGGGSPDPFVSLSINQRMELAKTKYKHNTFNPTWHETKFLLVNSLNEQLVLTLWDYNDHRKDTELGQATFDLAKLIDDAEHENIEQPILHDGKDRGLLRYHVSFYPVLKPKAIEEGGEAELPDTNVGIVRLTLHQAKELDQSKTTVGDLNPFARVFLGDSDVPQFSTNKLKHTTAPVWENSTEFLCADKHASVVTVKVVDDRDFLRDPVVGYMSVRLADLLAAGKEAGRDWWPLSGCNSGRVRLSAEWKPLNMAGSLHGADAYRPPIGAVRLHLQKAVDVKNVEATLGGKSDPYVRVQVAHVTLGRTDVINNNLNPEWDQIIYVPVHSLRETLMLECMDYQHLTKDRSLGTVEVRVSELVKESDDPDYPYASTGRKTAADPIRLDKGGVYKGKLHYVAEFVPALALAGVRFDGVQNEVQRAVEQGQGDDDGDVVQDDKGMSAAEIKAQAVPVGVTVRRPSGPTHKRGISTDTMATTATAATAATAAEKPEVTLSKEELLQHQSGILVCNVLRGMLGKRARLEVLLDDGYWPAFSTVKPRSTHASWDIIGEGVIKELDFGRVWLRLNDADEGDKDDVIAEWKGDAKEFLLKTLDAPGKFTLTDEDGRGTSTVEIESRYVPLPLKLEARESINNQGMLRVELIDGRDIIAADRGGKSDPFAVFSLNGSRVFKSQTKKKTLNPDWHESFVVGVSSRVGANFEVEIFDWNQIEQSKSLGSAKIELAELEPFQGIERVFSLSHTRYGDKGEVRLRLTFQPEVIAKSRKNTSTFSTAGRAMTQLGGLPVGGAKGVASGVGKVFRKDHAKGALSVDSGDSVFSPPAGQASIPVEPSMSTSSNPASATSTLSVVTAPTAFPSASTASLDGSINEPGTLRVTIMSAKDISADGEAAKPYVTLRVGDKEHKTKHVARTMSPEWNESFTFLAGSFTPKLHVWVYDHKTIGKDKLLGQGDIDIWRHIQARGNTAADVMLELQSGQGLLQARLEFDPDARPVNGPSRQKSPDPNGASPSRFSMSRRRLPPSDGASD